jgi:hypothetical protein
MSTLLLERNREMPSLLLFDALFPLNLLLLDEEREMPEP